VHSVAAALPASGANMQEKNYFPEPNGANVDFSSSHFNVQGHILSTGGDALTLSCLLISFTCFGVFFFFLLLLLLF
jgi:hypothetical protein